MLKRGARGGGDDVGGRIADVDGRDFEIDGVEMRGAGVERLGLQRRQQRAPCRGPGLSARCG